MNEKKLNFDFSTWGLQQNDITNVPVFEDKNPMIDASMVMPAEMVNETPFDQFDLIRMQNSQSFLVIKEKLAAMKIKAMNLEVKDEASNKLAMEMRVQIKALTRAADDAKNKLPAFKIVADFKNGVDKFIRETFKKPLAALDGLITPKINSYQQSQAEINRRIDAKRAEEAALAAKAEAEIAAKAEKEQQEKERQAAIDLQAKLNLDADDAGVERVAVSIPEVTATGELPLDFEVPVTQKTEKVITDHGSSKIESKWVCIIIDPNQISREYCMPDQKLLNAAVEAGVREIPGCKIEETFESTVRLSRKRIQDDIVF